MKMLPEHFTQLSALISVSRSSMAAESTYVSEGLSPTRYRWDAFWNISQKARGELGGKLYSYLNDDHIDTALRKIFHHSI